MSAFSGKFNWEEGIIWQVAFVAAKIDEELPPINPEIIHICQAMVDTGATTACISHNVAKELKLEPASKTDMQTASETVEVNVYDVCPAIVLPAMPDLEGNLKGEIQVFNRVSALEFNPQNKHYNALIGRDILSRGILTISFDGHFSFAF